MFAPVSGPRLTPEEPIAAPSDWVPHRPSREGTKKGGVFRLETKYTPAGDQPAAIAELVAQADAGDRDQVLLGVTGSGKTFTMAKVIEQTQRPALILAPNKTLAAQLYSEFKSFFPDNAVEYFVSYYDYYQPEAYVPRTDTYIEKDSSINEQIDRMRHSATRAILERDDVIVVASVSCIYGIGSVETYTAMTFTLKVGDQIDEAKLRADLIALQYKRNDLNFDRGMFRKRGDVIEIFPVHLEDRAWRISLFGDELETIQEFDPLTGKKTADLTEITVYAASHYVTPRPTLNQATTGIKAELKETLDWMVENGKLLEAQRLEQRTRFDLEMMEATGSCAGIENYSRWLTGRAPGEPPPTFFEYIPDNALLFVDESHVTVGQINGMFRGDYRRKSTLAEYGFPPALLHRQPPAEVRGMGGHAPPDGSRQRHPRPVGDGAGGRRLRGAGDPPHRPDRPAGRDSPGQRQDPQPGRRRHRRGQGDDGQGIPQPGHDPDQEDGRGPDRIYARTGGARPLHALRRRYAGADRDPARPAAGDVRLPDRHQPAARGFGHSRVRPGRHSGRGQGGFSFAPRPA